jgi:hypothetical protein
MSGPVTKAQCDALYALLLSEAGSWRCTLPQLKRQPGLVAARALRDLLGIWSAQCAVMCALRDAGRIGYWPGNAFSIAPKGIALKNMVISLTDLGTANRTSTPRVWVERVTDAAWNSAHRAAPPAPVQVSRCPAPAPRRPVIGEKFLACLKEVAALQGDVASVRVADHVPPLLRHPLIFNMCRPGDLAALLARARMQQRDIDDVLSDVIMAGLTATEQEVHDE